MGSRDFMKARPSDGFHFKLGDKAIRHHGNLVNNAHIYLNSFLNIAELKLRFVACSYSFSQLYIQCIIFFVISLSNAKSPPTIRLVIKLYWNFSPKNVKCLTEMDPALQSIFLVKNSLDVFLKVSVNEKFIQRT